MIETKTMRVLAVALILPLAACADMGEEGAEMETTDTAATTAPMEEPAAETIELQGVNDSGISGEIETESRGDSVFLDVRMDGTTGTDYPAHVHAGPCSAADAPVAAQVRLDWGASGESGAETGQAEERPSGGAGEAATTAQETEVRVGVAKADLTDPQGEYSLRFHGEGGQVIACADLPPRVTGSMGEEGAQNR